MKTTFIRLSGLIPLCIGLDLILHAGGILQESYSISNWPSVDGKVVSSKVVALKRTAGSKNSHSFPIAKVEYVYQVKGIAYTSSRISLMTTAAI